MTTDFRRLDPKFTGYTPTNAAEAVELFYKMKATGEVRFDDEIRVFQQLARALTQAEFDKFVAWITNPSHVPTGTAPDCLPSSGYIPSQTEEEGDEKEDEKSMGLPSEE